MAGFGLLLVTEREGSKEKRRGRKDWWGAEDRMNGCLGVTPLINQDREDCARLGTPSRYANGGRERERKKKRETENATRCSVNTFHL